MNAPHTATRQVLDRLQPTRMDASDRSPCHPRTRLGILQDISVFLLSPPDASGVHIQNVFWLYGLAGTGKSTTATTVANIVRDQRRLGAFIFFNRDRSEHNSPKDVIRTLAYKLADFDFRIGLAVAKAMKTNSGIIEAPLDTQFRVLLTDPLHSVADTLQEDGPIVVIVDALDECGDRDSREKLFSVFQERLPDLPKFLRIFITSRLETDIEITLRRPHVRGHELAIEETTREDVKIYLREQLGVLRNKRKLREDWPNEETVSGLAQRSHGLFIWASTVCKFIDAYNPIAHLKIVMDAELSHGAERALNDLYRIALTTAGQWDNEFFVADFQRVFGTIFSATQRLSRTAVDALASTSPTTPMDSLTLLEHFECLMSLKTDPENRIGILHPSFFDYLTTASRCTTSDGKLHPWFINPFKHRLHLGLRCLGIVRAQLHSTPSSPPKTRLVGRYHIIYASAFWTEHILSAFQSKIDGDDLALAKEHVRTFFSQPNEFRDWFNSLEDFTRLGMVEPIIRICLVVREVS